MTCCYSSRTEFKWENCLVRILHYTWSVWPCLSITSDIFVSFYTKFLSRVQHRKNSLYSSYSALNLTFSSTNTINKMNTFCDKVSWRSNNGIGIRIKNAFPFKCIQKTPRTHLTNFIPMKSFGSAMAFFLVS